MKEEKSDGILEYDVRAASDDMESNDESITDDDEDDEIRLHLLDEISVYMTTPSGGAPYLCPDCDYKTTIDVIYDDHRQSHTDYAASDCSDW